jgi:hypothetical protein
MTITRFVVIYCDGQTPDCPWGNDPMHGDGDQTATDLLRRGGWVTRNKRHICPVCQRPEIEAAKGEALRQP